MIILSILITYLKKKYIRKLDVNLVIYFVINGIYVRVSFIICDVI